MNHKNLLLGLLSLSSTTSVRSSDAPLLKDDQTVEFMNTYCYVNAEDKNSWQCKMQGFIYEQPASSQTFFIEALKSEIEDTGLDNPYLFKRRTDQCFRDGKSVERVRFTIETENQIEVRGPEKTRWTSLDGHFPGEFSISFDELPSNNLKSLVIQAKDEKNVMSGRLSMVPLEGISVISDIDDTIKDSKVLNRDELARNTFAREAKVVAGMPELYQSWANRKDHEVLFHYLSGSPVNLNYELKSFLGNFTFPEGNIWLRRMGDLFRDPLNYISQWLEFPDKYKVDLFKTDALKEMTNDFKSRKFILVGDAGEKDPEVYGQMARDIDDKDRILCIFIRVAEGADLSLERFNQAFEGVDENKWHVFENPKIIQNIDFDDILTHNCKAGGNETLLNSSNGGVRSYSSSAVVLLMIINVFVSLLL
eukprot:Awhi_evm1s12443